MDLEEIQLDDYQLAPYNPRVIDKAAYDGLSASMAKFGYVEPIVVNRRSKTIIGGHQRYRILKDQGTETATAVLVDLDEPDEKALNLTLNNPHIQGQFEHTGLDQLLHELDGLGYAEMEDLRLWELESPDVEDSPAPEVEQEPAQAEPKTRTCPECGHEWEG